MIVPVAHVGHWLESVAFAVPPIVLVALLVGAALIARRQEANR